MWVISVQTLYKGRLTTTIWTLECDYRVGGDYYIFVPSNLFSFSRISYDNIIKNDLVSNAFSPEESMLNTSSDGLEVTSSKAFALITEEAVSSIKRYTSSIGLTSCWNRRHTVITDAPDIFPLETRTTEAISRIIWNEILQNCFTQSKDPIYLWCLFSVLLIFKIDGTSLFSHTPQHSCF